MKIRLERNGTVFEYDRKPMEIGRFTILSRLAGTMICGAALLGLVRMLGLWGLIWSLVGMVLVGVYRLICTGCID